MSEPTHSSSHSEETSTASGRVWRVKRAPKLQAKLRVPGDKSISHRAAMLAGLGDGLTEVVGFLPSEDCLSSVKIMEALGAKVTVTEMTPGLGSTGLKIEGTGGKLSQPTSALDCGNSGTTMRLMSGVLAAQEIHVEMIGDVSLSKRPMNRVINPLKAMGANLHGQGEKGVAPIHVHGGKLQAIRYELPMASAQVKSAVLLAGMQTEGTTTVIEPEITRDHTERMFEAFGIQFTKNGKEISIEGPQVPKGRHFTIPGDISSAAFWLVASAAQKDSEITIEGVGLNPTRTGILEVLKRMGAEIELTDVIEHGEPLGTIRLRGKGLKGTIIQGAEIPNVIDELPILAVAGALAEGITEIRDAKELRVKETDRIAAVAGNLRAMGAKVEEREDGMVIHGGLPLHGATLETFHDHRIAMAFSIAGLFAEGETVINGVECVATSYPGFDTHLHNAQSGIAEWQFGSSAQEALS